jgi:iron complex transport system substrate-binding protein
VAISTFETPVPASLSRFEELAAALGADRDAPDVIVARERFANASEALRQAVAEKSDLRVLIISAWPEAIYVANPAAASDLLYFQELGVNIVVPDDPDAYWDELSWEQALKYPADVILLDERDGGFTVENVAEAPSTLAAHPAVKAGQLGNWYTEFVLSYDAFAAVLEELAATIHEARVIG